MSDLERLLAAFDSGDLARPSPDKPNAVDLTNALAHISGAPGRGATPGSRALAELIGPARHIVVVMVDGLGMNVVRNGHGAEFLSANVAAELMTVFPSTTPTVLTTLATGLWPSQHGVPNWDLYLDEIDAVAAIINFVRRGDEADLASLGMTPERAYPVESMIPELGWPSMGVVPEEIAATPYSSYWRGHTPCYGYKALDDAAEAVLRRLDKADGPTFTHVYLPHVDAASHEYGIGHEALKQAIAAVDGWLSQLADMLPPGAVMVVSADHGLLNAGERNVHEIEPTDELVECLAREPWGTGRAAMFQAREERAGEFEARFRERLGEHFYLLPTDEALGLGLLGPGPVSPVTRRRIGNYLAISTGAPVIYYKYPRAENERTSAASHGGLTPDEMLTPLVVARSQS